MWLNDTTKVFHAFANASTTAYDAAVYLRTENEDNRVKIKLLIAKCTVAPIQTISLPRLLAEVLKELRCEEVWYWTNSPVTVRWIKSQSEKSKLFVSNRVKEIQALSSFGMRHYCTGYSNPADLLTKGISARLMKESSLWWQGLNWLQLQQDFWLQELYGHDPKGNQLKEQKQTRWLYVTQSLQFDTLRISSPTKLLNITAWIIQFPQHQEATP